MKILPQNNNVVQDLNFRLRLDIKFDRQVKIAIPEISDFIKRQTAFDMKTE